VVHSILEDSHWVLFAIVQFRMILKIILKKENKKRQASSSKQRLTMVQGSCRMYIERYIMDNEQLKRIADAMEEIIRMVKKDQQETRERFEKRWDKEDE